MTLVSNLSTYCYCCQKHVTLGIFLSVNRFEILQRATKQEGAAVVICQVKNCMWQIHLCTLVRDVHLHLLDECIFSPCPDVHRLKPSPAWILTTFAHSMMEKGLLLLGFLNKTTHSLICCPCSCVICSNNHWSTKIEVFMIAPSSCCSLMGHYWLILYM